MTIERKATVVASVVSAILTIIKVVIGIASGSVAVLASAIDSALDLIISGFNFFALTRAEKPADDQFNYGHGKVEALAAVIEGTIITVSGVFILYQAISKAITHEEVEMLTTSIYVMLVSLAITIALVLFLNYVAAKSNNLVIKSDALHYKTDLYTNVAILISLVIVNQSGYYIVDSIIGGAIAIYIIYSAYEIIKEGVYILLDASLDEELVDEIKKIITNEPGVNDYHFLKTRKSGKDFFVDVHLVLSPEISLLEAHRISDRVEEKIEKLNTEANWVQNIHLDPYDDSVINEEEALQILKINK